MSKESQSNFRRRKKNAKLSNESELATLSSQQV
jgi:hypothetical protein